MKWLALAVVAGALSTLAGSLAAQQPARREPRGFDFSRDGVWRRRARDVARVRNAALARADFALLNDAAQRRGGARPLFESALMAAPTSAAVTGVLRVPTLLVRYAGTDTTTSKTPAQYDSVLYAAVPLTGRPYSVRTYFEEISNGMFSVQGVVVGWITMQGTEGAYAGPSGCNGLSSSCGNVPGLIQQAVATADPTIDWSLYDNDGPDGVPNSGDDDGRVDLIYVIHSTTGAECGPFPNTHIWSHRFSYSGWTGSSLATQDARSGTGFIRIDDYTIQAGVGGATCSDAGTIMAPGTIAHETGHGLNLPDFYDTDPSDGDDSEGIGEWGLMGSGNYARPLSPAHMEAFSLSVLGWLTVRPVTTSGTYTLGPVQSGDTALMLRTPAGGAANPRGEYFLIENRQAVGSDTALIDRRGGTGGLLIWHVDSAQYYDPGAQFGNTVNSGSIHGVWLMQADGQNQLRSSTPGVRNRGDGGDLFPGTAARTSFGAAGLPAARLNTAGTPFAGFIVDSIRQVVPNGEMAMRIRFAGLAIVRASDSTAQVLVRGAPYSVYRDALPLGDTLTISIDTFQTGNGGRSEFRFASWTDGGARTHTINGAIADTTVSATLFVRHKVTVIASGSGTVGSNPTLNLAAGEFVDRGTVVALTATPAAGQAFAGWSGDTAAPSANLSLGMQRPFTLTATFNAQLVVLDTVLTPPVMGATYLDTLRMSGGTGAYTFTVTSGQVPHGLSLSGAGVLSGAATRDSTYNLVVRVASGGQPALLLPLRLAVTAPTLVLADVVARLLSGGATLTADQIRYLDLIGNANNQLDIGDVVAWVDKTGLSLNADVLYRLMQRKAP